MCSNSLQANPSELFYTVILWTMGNDVINSTGRCSSMLFLSMLIPSLSLFCTQSDMLSSASTTGGNHGIGVGGLKLSGNVQSLYG